MTEIAHFNFRDLGGLPAGPDHQVRPGRLFRGASLQALRGAERDTVAALGLSTVVDLRSTAELAHYGRFPDGVARTVRHAPIFEATPPIPDTDDGAAWLATLYDEMLGMGSAAIGSIIADAASDDGVPLLFFCAAGKDRTGITAAILLRLIGVDDEAIVTDYARSGPNLEQVIERLTADDAAAREHMNSVPGARRASPPAAIRAFLATLDERHGSAEGYAREIGLGPEVVDDLRRTLLVTR